MKRWQPFIPLLILLLGTSAALSQIKFEEADEVDETESVVKKMCVSAQNIRSFNAIDDQHLYVSAYASNKHFLFTMQRRCLGLRSAINITVKDKSGRLCSNSFGAIIYSQMGRGTETCSIDTVEAIGSREDAWRLVDERKRVKEKEKSAN
jgi:Family of unknown function (DUF6491)